MMTELSPYGNGYKTYWELVLMEDMIAENPYPPGSAEAAEFMQGLQDAQSDRDFDLRRI